MNSFKRKHAKFAPSSAHRWMNCFGAVRLSALAPPPLDSEAAIKGTIGHEVLEYQVKRFGNLKRAREESLKIALARLKKCFPRQESDWDDEAREMVECATKSAEIIYSLKPAVDAKLLVETRVKLPHVSKDLWGSLDYAWVDEWGTLVVIDYKYGAGIAVLPFDEDGEPNPQLMVYASGVAKKFNYEFDRVKLCIIQPRVWAEDESPLTEGFTTLKKLKQFEKDAAEAITKGKSPNGKLNAGEWCQFCPALATCPEVSHKQMVKADIVFDVETGIEAIPDPKGLTVKTLPKVLEACDILEDWIKAVREYAFRLADSGKTIPGFKLVPRRGMRAWLPSAERAAKAQFGSLAFSKPELLSPAQLEKAAGKSGAAKFLEKHCTIVSSGLTLVKEKDARPETSPIAFDIDSKKVKK